MFDKCTITLPVWYSEDDLEIKEYLKFRDQTTIEKARLNSKIRKSTTKNIENDIFKV